MSLVIMAIYVFAMQEKFNMLNTSLVEQDSNAESNMCL